MHELIDKVFNLIIKFIYSIGFFGEPITMIYACFMLYLSKTYLFTYIFVYIIFKWIVEKLKNIIRDPRPNKKRRLFANKIKYIENIHHSYGMPSGHASGVSFTLTFVYLLTYKYLIQSLAILGITITQRYVFRNHTMYQLIAGTILGISVATIVVNIMKKLNKI